MAIEIPERNQSPQNKYCREILPGVWVDVYEVLNAFKTGDAAIDHAVKKLLAPGQRGAKDRLTDCNEAIQSINRSIQIQQLQFVTPEGEKLGVSQITKTHEIIGNKYYWVRDKATGGYTVTFIPTALLESDEIIGIIRKGLYGPIELPLFLQDIAE
jgi:hypothetical protein